MVELTCFPSPSIDTDPDGLVSIVSHWRSVAAAVRGDAVVAAAARDADESNDVVCERLILEVSDADWILSS